MGAETEQELQGHFRNIEIPEPESPIAREMPPEYASLTPAQTEPAQAEGYMSPTRRKLVLLAILFF